MYQLLRVLILTNGFLTCFFCKAVFQSADVSHTCELRLFVVSSISRKICVLLYLLGHAAACTSVYFPPCCIVAHMIVTLCVFGRCRLVSKCLLIVLNDSGVRGRGKTDSASGPGVVSGNLPNRLFLSPLLFSTVWTKGC